MEQRETVTLIAGETLDCTSGARLGRKVVALIPVGYSAKACARTCGNTTGAKQD